MIIISLGCCCEVSFVIKSLFPSQLRYPFDWLSIRNLDIIAELIETKFENFDKKIVNGPGKNSDDIVNTHLISDDTLKRRVERFKKMISCGEKILFILKLHYVGDYDTFYAKNVSWEKCKALRDSIGKFTNNFTLLVVNESNKKEQRREEQNGNTNLVLDWITGPFFKGNGGGLKVVRCNYKGEYNKEWLEIINRVI